MQMSNTEDNRIHILLGMPRAGTTFLYHNFSKHPNIFLPFRRKTNYYAAHFNKGYDFFKGHFDEMTYDQIGLDTDTLSFLNTDSYDRFKKDYRGQKVILVVRSPSSWSLSLYKQISSFTQYMPTFESYVKDGFNLVEDATNVPFKFTPGLVADKISKISNDFKGNLLILNYDLLKKDALLFMKTIESFLGVDSFFNKENIITQKINSSDRNSNKFISALLRKKWLIYILQNFIPRKLVMKIRYVYDSLSVKKKKNTNIVNSNNDPEMDFAKEYYALDEVFVQELFANSDILLR
jgi:hypothetical protein